MRASGAHVADDSVAYDLVAAIDQAARSDENQPHSSHDFDLCTSTGRTGYSGDLIFTVVLKLGEWASAGVVGAAVWDALNRIADRLHRRHRLPAADRREAQAYARWLIWTTFITEGVRQPEDLSWDRRIETLEDGYRLVSEVAERETGIWQFAFDDDTYEYACEFCLHDSGIPYLSRVERRLRNPDSLTALELMRQFSAYRCAHGARPSGFADQWHGCVGTVNAERGS